MGKRSFCLFGTLLFLAFSATASVDYCIVNAEDHSFVTEDVFELNPGEYFDIYFLGIEDGVFQDLPGDLTIECSEINGLVDKVSTAYKSAGFTGTSLKAWNVGFAVSSTVPANPQGRLYLKNAAGKVLKTVTVKVQPVLGESYHMYDWNLGSILSSATVVKAPGDHLDISFLRFSGGEFTDVPDGCRVDASELYALLDDYRCNELELDIPDLEAGSLRQLNAMLDIGADAKPGSQGCLYLKDSAGKVLRTVIVKVVDRRSASYCVYDNDRKRFLDSARLELSPGDVVNLSFIECIDGVFTGIPGSFIVDFTEIDAFIAADSDGNESSWDTGRALIERQLHFEAIENAVGGGGGRLYLRDGDGKVLKTVEVSFGVEYVDAAGRRRWYEGPYGVVTKSTTAFQNGRWYVVPKDADLTCATIAVDGDVRLILCDGGALRVQGKESAHAGLEVNSGNSITIYGQSQNTGALIAHGGAEGAGIGGASYQGGGDVTINGGLVSAEGLRRGAGIGGGYRGGGGTVTINGGRVSAVGGADDDYGGAGIGGGVEGPGGMVVINGGSVDALAPGGTGGEQGIGCGYNGKDSGRVLVAPFVVVKNVYSGYDQEVLEHYEDGIVDSEQLCEHVSAEVPPSTTKYAVVYSEGWEFTYQVFVPGKVGVLSGAEHFPSVPGYIVDGWMGSDGRFYQEKLLVFDLASPGRTLQLNLHLGPAK